VAIDLCNHRTLDLGIHEVSHQRVWRVERGLDVDKFGKRNIRTAVLGCDEAKGGVGDTVHGREPDDGFIYLLPEIHVASVKVPRPNTPSNRKRSLIKEKTAL
jgi:hypothetical protein